jgi:hypothetical protein
LTERYERRVTCPDHASALRFMQAPVFKCAPAAGCPLKADGSGLHDWQAFAISGDDGPVTVVIRQLEDAARACTGASASRPPRFSAVPSATIWPAAITAIQSASRSASSM